MRYLLLTIGMFLICTPLLMQANSMQSDGDQGVVLGVATARNKISHNTQYVTFIEMRILEEINARRMTAGLRPLKQNKVMNTVSRRHSNDLSLSSHVRDDIIHNDLILSAPTITHEGTTFGASHHERLATYGIDAAMSGENIIAQPLIDLILLEDNVILLQESFSLDVLISESVDAWMRSLEHRANILLPEYTHTGIGAAISGQYIIITQVFTQQPL